MSRRIIDYRLVHFGSVGAAIQKGWQPWGSPSTANGEPRQAVVKYADEPEETSAGAAGVAAERTAVVEYLLNHSSYDVEVLAGWISAGDHRRGKP